LKTSGKINRLTILVAGFLVLAIPLWFFWSLLHSALERTREASLGLLREEILQTAEQIRTQMKPASYVKEVIKKVHSELLPEITPDIVKMVPDKDFGHEQFSAALPEKLLTSLRSKGLDALHIIVMPPGLTDVYYWNSEALRQQCKDEEKLAWDQCISLVNSGSRLYMQHYQKPWPGSSNLPPLILKALSLNKGDFCFAYLSRFSEMYSFHDQVDEYFTDYFGQQSLFSYSYHCISSKNIHGNYSIIVPQSSIEPAKVVKAALKLGNNGMSAAMTDLKSPESGFKEVQEKLEYYTRPPSDFWSHYFFKTGDRSQAQKSRYGGWHIKITADFPRELVQQQQSLRLFSMLATLGLMSYFAGALRFWLFGFSLGNSIRSKLTAILGLIILLPIAGTGALTWVGLNGSERVIENHLLQETLNTAKELGMINDENILRQMVSVLEMKKILSGLNRLETDIKGLLSLEQGANRWYTTWTTSFSSIFESGQNFQVDHIGNTSKINRLLLSLLGKYLDSLGLRQVENEARRGNFSQTMTLGLMENYITPWMEEALMSHEGTVQRDITHSADTSRAAFYLVKNRSGQHQLVFQRLSNGDAHVYRYLTWFSQNLPEWFTRKGKYGDLSLGIRLRKYFDLHMFAWPPEALLSKEMTAIFERAISTRDLGQSVTRKNGGLEVRTWRYNHGESSIIAVLGKSRGSGITGLAAFMVFPALLAYAILVLYFITAIIAAFITEPVKIINTGIKALHEERYGVLIASFSGDEFENMTQAFNEMSNALRQREMMKRYVSGRLIQEVQTSNLAENAHVGQLVKITALASDIRGFTAISEKYTPAEIVEMLNSYFTIMEEEISRQGGVIDKYVGDAVQALFYHDSTQENATVRACRAALRMRSQLAVFNTRRLEQGLFTVENGIGIDTGLGISGSIGSESGRKDYTVVGNVIEEAASIESRTRECDSKILLSLAAGREVEGLASTRGFDNETLELIDV